MPQPTHRVFNLVLSKPSVRLGGYVFRRRPDYPEAIRKLPQVGQVAAANIQGPDGSPFWVGSRTPGQGINAHTYDATWDGRDPEPHGVFIKEAPLVTDILLLWTLWGDRHVFTREPGIEPAYSAYYFSDWHLEEPDRMTAVDEVASSLRRKFPAKFPFNPLLHVLLQSDKSQFAEIRALILMPCLDLACSATPPGFRRKWSDEQSKSLKHLKKALLKVLQTAKDPELVANAITPFEGDVARLGSPRAADQLVAFYRWSLGFLNLPENVLTSHAKALNVVRNAVVHRAASPTKLTVEFTNRAPITIPKNAPPEDLIRGMLCTTRVAHALIKRHASSLLGIGQAYLNPADMELRRFFASGMYNDTNVYEEWFSDRIIG